MGIGEHMAEAEIEAFYSDCDANGWVAMCGCVAVTCGARVRVAWLSLPPHHAQIRLLATIS